MAVVLDRSSRTIFNPLYGDSVTFLETCLETGGARSVAELTVHPGGGNPRHRHHTFAETFEPIEGELGVHKAGREHLVRPGESVTAEIGDVHRFYNPGTTPVRSRVILTPGHLGLEQALMIVYGLAADGLTRADGTPKDLEVMAHFAILGETRLVGPLAMLHPLFGWLDRRARRKGKDVELARRYLLDCSNPAVQKRPVA